MRGGMAITALAGPLSNLLMAVLSMVIYRVFCCFQVVQTAVVDYYTSGGVNTYFVLYYMLQAFIFINLGLSIFNLIPIPPLDGSHILGYFTSSKVDAFFYKNQRVISIVFMVILVTGVLSGPIGFVEQHIYNLLLTLTNWIPNLLGTL